MTRFERFRAGLLPDLRDPRPHDYRLKPTRAQRQRSLLAMRRGKRQDAAAKRWSA
jgi:hypothetical protein